MAVLPAGCTCVSRSMPPACAGCSCACEGDVGRARVLTVLCAHAAPVLPRSLCRCWRQGGGPPCVTRGLLEWWWGVASQGHPRRQRSPRRTPRFTPRSASHGLDVARSTLSARAPTVPSDAGKFGRGRCPVSVLGTATHTPRSVGGARYMGTSSSCKSSGWDEVRRGSPEPPPAPKDALSRGCADAAGRPMGGRRLEGPTTPPTTPGSTRRWAASAPSPSPPPSSAISGVTVADWLLRRRGLSRNGTALTAEVALAVAAPAALDAGDGGSGLGLAARAVGGTTLTLDTWRTHAPFPPPYPPHPAGQRQHNVHPL
jgi:hypothetical protein